jgi:hypothetical protein
MYLKILSRRVEKYTPVEYKHSSHALLAVMHFSLALMFNDCRYNSSAEGFSEIT